MKNIIVSNPISRNIAVSRAGLKRNGMLAVFCLVLFGGIVCGAISGRSADDELMKRLDVIFLTNFDLRCSRGFIMSFGASFGSNVLFMLAVFLLGLSLWGGFFSAAIPFIKGYGYGLTAGFLYCTYGVKGILYNILIILPGMFISSVVISAASVYSFRNSLKSVQSYRLQAVRDDPRQQLKTYLMTMLWLLLLCAGASLADMLCSICFSWIFHF